MKKQYLTAIALGLCMLCTLNSCINKDYDWDNLNKEITFQIGNVPLGNVAPIRIDSILESNIKSDTEFQYDASGNVLLQYRGNIPIDIPKFDDIKVEDKTTGTTVTLPTGTLPPSFNIIIGEKLAYSIPEPEKNSDWEIDIQKVEFTKSELYIDIYLEGINLNNSTTNLNVDITFPTSVKFNDKMIDENNSLSLSPKLSEFRDDKVTYGPYFIEMFDYTENDENILYDVVLNGNEFIANNETLTFYMVIRTEDIEPSLVYAKAKFTQDIDGNVNDIDALNDIFQDGDYFTLNNPGMVFYMETNLGFDFNVSIENMEAFYSDTSVPLSPFTPGGMDFLANQKETKIGYYIAQTNDSTAKFDNAHFFERDLNELISVKPYALDYKIKAKTKGDEPQSGVFPFNDPYMDAEYLFNIPFNFKKIVVTFEEVMEDVFSDDIAEKLFNNEGEFIIVADEVIVQLGGSSSQANVTLSITATVYDYYNEPIDIDIAGATLSNGTHPLEIVMKIREEDTYKMQTAKHIGFSFKIEGKNLTLNKSDYIAINKLKFKTTAGFSWEF